MNVVRLGAGEMVVESRPNVKALVAGGILTCAVGLLILLMTEAVVTLRCTRTGGGQGSIELTTQTLLGSKTRRLAVNEISAVVIRSSVSRNSGGVVLRTSTGDFSLAALSSGEATTLAGRMTQFLSNPEAPDLTIRRDYRLAAYFLGSGVVGIGLFLLALSSERVQCAVDRNERRIIVERKTVLTIKRLEYPLKQVADLRVHTVGPRRRAKVIYLILTSGARVHAGWPDGSDAVARMRAFLDAANSPASSPPKPVRV